MAQTKQQGRQRREVGYILLEECHIVITNRGATEVFGLGGGGAGSPQPNFRLGAWYDVDLFSEPPPVLAENDNIPSDGCDLVLYPRFYQDQYASTSDSPVENHVTSFATATSILPFHGLIFETIAKKNFPSNDLFPQDATTATSKQNKSAKNSRAVEETRTRSDASLLAGLALEVNRQGYQFELEHSLLKLPPSRDDVVHSKGGNEIENSDFRFLRPENAMVMILDEVSFERSNFKSEKMVEKIRTHQPASITVRASFLVLFSLPLKQSIPNNHISNPINTSGNIQNSRTIGNNPNHNTKANNKKKYSLSSALQLVGSMIRCDWAHLESVTNEIRLLAMENRNKASSLKESDSPYKRVSGESRHLKCSCSRKPFFPKKLNLEELYFRISGASGHIGKEYQINADDLSFKVGSKSPSHTMTGKTKQNSTSHRPIGLIQLPDDVIATYIGTYLRARSLQALLSTCRRIYRALLSVVPGMKLKLFPHQIRSLEWMQRRERHCISEAGAIRSLSNENFLQLNAGESTCGGDYHRAVTGGETVLVALRPDVDEGDIFVAQQAMRFDSQSGDPVATTAVGVTHEPFCRKSARGGLLCDDPGLGKTITVLSLILRTFGLSTEPKEESQSSEIDNDAIFDAYWNDHLTSFARQPAILKLISRLMKSDKESYYFEPPVESWLDEAPDYYDVIENPISMHDIRIRCDKTDCSDFNSFVADVRLCLTNAIAYNTPDNVVHIAAKRLVKKFDELVCEFKQDHVNQAVKSLANISKRCGPTRLVGMLEAKKRKELIDPLLPSASTLLVVPNFLFQHWEDQILLYIDFQYCTETTQNKFIYHHTSRKRKCGRLSKYASSDVNDFKNGHPLVLVDDGTKRLPSPEVLSRFKVVLTSYNRLSSEWRHGSVESELRASKKGGKIYALDEKAEASDLLKVHWLRLIVDEGHVMGKKTNNAIVFGSWITAQRRWVMTGTPTPQVANKSDALKNVFYLLSFLKHDFHKRGQDKSWNELISKGWSGGNMSSFYRLKNLLSH
mmetsp:Transcript_19166/g.39273  ORF Transcript_19166/g.39273 Transcript_19166/m.39273 type:complete len:1020 (+) Transcript_19166:46-3105(+)